MVAITSPAVVPVAGAAFVRPIKAGDGLRLFGSSSGSVGLKPAAAAGSVDFTLPAADGSSGHVLQTNGSAVLSFSQLAHSALSGLTSGDDHTQYLLLAGRSTGQSLNGGTAASESLTIESTAHSTKGVVRIAHSGGDVWLGRNASTAVKLKLFEATGSGNHSTSFEAQNQSADISYILPASSSNGWLANTSGTLSWTYPGSDTQVLFNDGGTPAGDASLIWNKTNNRLGIGDTTGIATPSKHLHIAGTTDTEGLLIDFVNDNHTTQQGQILFRNARGTYSSKSSSFSASLLNRIAFEAHDGTTYRPCADISCVGLNNPAGGQSYFPGKIMFMVGTYDSTLYTNAMTISGGNAAFTAVPRISMGNGTVDGNLPLEITMASTADAAIHMQNASGDASLGIDSSGRLQLTKSGFISSSTRMVMTSSQVHWVQDTNVYGTGEVVVEGDGTGVLFGVCRQANPPGANTAFLICDWTTAQHTKLLDNGGAIWNEAGNDADSRWESDGDENCLFVDGGVNAVGIGIGAPLAKLHIVQPSTTGAKPVLTLNQADVDEDYFKFIGTSDTSADRALVDAANFPNPGAIAGWLKVNVQDDQGTNPIADGDYYIPFYSVPTA